MWFLASWIGRIVGLAIIAAAVLVIIAGSAYAADKGIEADVVERDCQPLGGSHVTVETRWFSIQKTVEVGYQECQVVPQSGFVVYHLRTGRTLIYENEGGECIWDTSIPGPC